VKTKQLLEDRVLVTAAAVDVDPEPRAGVAEGVEDFARGNVAREPALRIAQDAPRHVRVYGRAGGRARGVDWR
jgi:hypothetical protein